MFEIHGKRQVAAEKESPWKNDALRREEFGKVLIGALDELASPSTIALIGRWGSGKTTFLKMLSAEFEGRGGSPAVVYFGAWGRDFADDPFASFCAAIHSELLNHAHASDVEKKTKFLSKARGVIGTAIAATLRAGSGIAGGLISAHVGHDPVAGAALAENAAATLTKKAIELAADKVQQAARKAPDAREEFRDSLSKVVAALSDDKQDASGKCRLLILVDELDRCRPDFAIRLLETIKHFFDVPGVTFLLAYDEEYLTSATRAIYGPLFDAEMYLRRFVDIRFWLPAADSKNFIKRLVDHYGFDAAFLRSKNAELAQTLSHSLIEWIDCLDLSLRDAEQALAACRLMVTRLAQKEDVEIYPCLFCCVAKFSNPSLLANVISGSPDRGKFSEILNYFSPRMKKNNGNFGVEWKWLEALFKHADQSHEHLLAYMNGPAAQVYDQETHVVNAAMRSIHKFPYGDRWREYLNQVR